MCPFIFMDALFLFVAPIVALKINVKVDWSSCHFSQNFNIRITDDHGFSCIDVSQVHREILKTEATDLVAIVGILISQSYMLLMPVVVLSCISLCQNQCQYWSGQGGQCRNTSRRISKLYQNNDVCIDWSLRSSDMSTVEHFGQRVRRIIMATINP